NGINMDLIRLRLAYGRMDWKNFSLEAGQDWSVFAPLNPTTLAEFAIPGMSASGNPWIRMPQIRGEYHKAVLGESAEFKWQFAAIYEMVQCQRRVVRGPRAGHFQRGRG